MKTPSYEWHIFHNGGKCTLHCTDMAIHFHEQRSSYQSRRFFCGCSSSKDESLFHYVMHTVQKSSNSSLYFWFKNIYIYIYIHRITVIINNNKKDNNNNKNVTSSTGLIRRNFLCKSQEHFQLVFLKSIVQKYRGWLFDLLVVV